MSLKRITTTEVVDPENIATIHMEKVKDEDSGVPYHNLYNMYIYLKRGSKYYILIKEIPSHEVDNILKMLGVR